MKKLKRVLLYTLTTLVVLAVFLYFKIGSVFMQDLKHFEGEPNLSSMVKHDSSKKTIFIVAENSGTEMFDLMAPYYLFNATGRANVYVVSEKKGPILLVNSLFILPHYSFAEIDSLHIVPDAVVVPNLNVHLHVPPRTTNVSWIKKQISEHAVLLAICDGSATAAATGLYDGKPITTHASDFDDLKKMFPRAHWINNTSVTESGNLYSTAGVSNAVEGSLTVIKRMFGEETMQSVLHDIRYPRHTVQTMHESKVVGANVIATVLSKTIFRRNEKLGVMLQDNINEFELGSLLDTYARTFPSSFNTFSVNNTKITSKYGLTLYPTGDIKTGKVDELHVLQPVGSSAKNLFEKARNITYEKLQDEYPIDHYLKRISSLYGRHYKDCVKVTLDYN